MRLYTAYGLRISSHVPLSGVAAAEPGPPDVEIVPRILADEEMECTPDGQRIGAFFFDIARFLIVGGHTVYVDVRRAVEPAEIEARLLGEIMATLLRQRGQLVVHACAVEREGAAVAFAGESGWGKSTLAEFLCQQGYRLLTDDVMALTDAEGEAVVVPSYPQIRLREDAAAFLVPGAERLEALSRNGPKQARNGVAMPEAPVPLRALFFLEPTFADQTQAAPIAPAEALMRLIAHTRAKGLIHTNAPVLLRDHLAHCARLVRNVPTALLQRRRGLSGLPLIGDVVSQALDVGVPLGADPLGGGGVLAAPIEGLAPLR